MKEKQKVAIFDIDGTIFRSSLLIELVEVLLDKKLFPEEARAEFLAEENLWLDRKDSYEEYITAVVRVFVKYIKGIHYGDLVEASNLVFENHKDRVYVYTRDLVKDLKSKGYFLLAISQSPKTTIDPFAKYLGFDKVYGRGYEIGPNDQFTGEVMDVNIIENKANIVKRAVEKADLTLEGSIAVGDTEGDISMLEMVENPIAFNPNKNLYRYAKRADWKVVVERKDVVYDI
ncbi:MAG: HAD superfamily hydrolase (TIGR01490 family) [Candidatus Paceibacteria bacterium]|jgi:HAD superfamily hydrolase (TIGR01490 family)